MSSDNQIFENTNSLYRVHISSRWGKEYVPMLDDIVRFVAIQSIIQLMLYTMDGNSFPFFSPDFFLLVLFIVIGVMFYHLVVKRVVVFQ